MEEISRPAISLSAVTNGCARYGAPILEVVIGKDGLVTAAKFIRRTGCKAADARIAAWVKKWLFHPATKDGRPIAKPIKVSVNIDQ